VILGLLKDDVSSAFEEWYKELPVINGEECERKRSCPVLRYYFDIWWVWGGGGGLELYPNTRFSEGDLNLITAKYETCEFELLYHDVNLYFGEISFV
jgi:hypothetical protein